MKTRTDVVVILFLVVYLFIFSVYFYFGSTLDKVISVAFILLPFRYLLAKDKTTEK